MATSMAPAPAAPAPAQKSDDTSTGLLVVLGLGALAGAGYLVFRHPGSTPPPGPTPTPTGTVTLHSRAGYSSAGFALFGTPYSAIDTSGLPGGYSVLVPYESRFPAAGAAVQGVNFCVPGLCSAMWQPVRYTDGRVLYAWQPDTSVT